MPSKTKLQNAVMAARTVALPSMPKELMDQLVSRSMRARPIWAPAP